MSYLGLDIGGANLKAADGRGFAALRYFPLWRDRDGLTAELERLLAAAPPAKTIVATMTGELADCFATKAEGVRTIVHAMVDAAGGRRTLIYLTSGAFVAPEQAVAQPLLSAAANWHALARFAGRYAAEGTGMLVDIGSTTSDLIPLDAGRPAAAGRTDPERLVAGELVYTGVERSPVCAQVRSLPWRGQDCPVAQELFATSLDFYLLLGELPENELSLQTADGRPATRTCAQDRLARMICADKEQFDSADALAAARRIALAQLELLAGAARQVATRIGGPPRTIVTAGHGEFLAMRLIDRLGWPARVVSLSVELTPPISRCATAHALAVIARESLEGSLD